MYSWNMLDVCPLISRLQYHMFADDMQYLKRGLVTDAPHIEKTVFEIGQNDHHESYGSGLSARVSECQKIEKRIG